MTFKQLVLLVFYTAGLFCGQMLFKKVAVAQSTGTFTLIDKIVALAFNGYFILTMILYLLLSLFWVWILQIVPLSRAYPFVALNFALVAIAGVVWFSEELSALNWLGLLLIFTGVILLTVGN